MIGPLINLLCIISHQTHFHYHSKHYADHWVAACFRNCELLYLDIYLYHPAKISGRIAG
jgi:hypothetical protein